MSAKVLISFFCHIHTRHLVCHSGGHKQGVADFSLPSFQIRVGVFSRQTLELMSMMIMVIVHSPSLGTEFPGDTQLMFEPSTEENKMQRTKAIGPYSLDSSNARSILE